jgi:hypothetical protein
VRPSAPNAPLDASDPRPRGRESGNAAPTIGSTSSGALQRARLRLPEEIKVGTSFSGHSRCYSNELREFDITDDGIVIGNPVLGYEGLLGGRPMPIPASAPIEPGQRQ